MKKRRWQFWKALRNWCESRMEKAWFSGGNCDSRCPNCKNWESRGNLILTESLDDGTERRKCDNCGHQWLAIFTPSGFIPNR